MKGKNATTSFCLRRRKVDKSDLVTKSPISQIEKCLAKDQAKHIYEMVKMNKPVNIHAMKQDINNDSKIRVRSEEVEIDSDLNPYQMAILNKRPKDDAKTEQMINWSIFSDKIT